MKNLLTPSDSVKLTYVGFASNGFCASPSEPFSFYYNLEPQEKYKCEEHQTGYYSPLCRPWFQNTLANPDKIMLSDLYRYAQS